MRTINFWTTRFSCFLITFLPLEPDSSTDPEYWRSYTQVLVVICTYFSRNRLKRRWHYVLSSMSSGCPKQEEEPQLRRKLITRYCAFYEWVLRSLQDIVCIVQILVWCVALRSSQQAWTLDPRCENWRPTNLCKFCRHQSNQSCKYSDKIREYSDTLHWHHKRGKKQCTRQRLSKQQQKRQTQYSNMCNMQLLTKSMK